MKLCEKSLEAPGSKPICGAWTVLLEALSSWTTGTEAHLEIQVGALFPEGFAWAEEGRLNLSKEWKLYSWLFYMIAFEIVKQSHAFSVERRENNNSSKADEKLQNIPIHRTTLISQFVFTNVLSLHCQPYSLLVSCSPLPPSNTVAGHKWDLCTICLALINLPLIYTFIILLSISHQSMFVLILSSQKLTLSVLLI